MGEAKNIYFTCLKWREKLDIMILIEARVMVYSLLVSFIVMTESRQRIGGIPAAVRNKLKREFLDQVEKWQSRHNPDNVTSYKRVNVKKDSGERSVKKEKEVRGLLSLDGIGTNWMLSWNETLPDADGPEIVIANKLSNEAWRDKTSGKTLEFVDSTMIADLIRPRSEVFIKIPRHFFTPHEELELRFLDRLLSAKEKYEGKYSSRH